MGKKGGDSAGSDRADMSGKGVSPRVLADPQSLSDTHPPSDGHDDTGSYDHAGPSQPLSAPQKAQELPQKMWMIVTAGLLVWTAIAIVVLLFFF